MQQSRITHHGLPERAREIFRTPKINPPLEHRLKLKDQRAEAHDPGRSSLLKLHQQVDIAV